jgi:hypothetical protein
MRNSNTYLFAIFMFAITLFSEVHAQSMDEFFQSPPESARPYTWWHWLNGNVSKEGITKDLEAMKEVGIGGFQHFDAGLNFPQGPVLYNSDKFHELMAFAISEAERLGLDAGFNNASGWSSSGGPWVIPENSMKTLIWSETQFAGGESKDIKLSLPEITPDQQKGKNPKKFDFYRDVVVLAFPTPENKEYRLQNWKEKSMLSQDTKPDKFTPALNVAPSDAIIPLGKVIDLSEKMDENGKLDWTVPTGNWTVVRIGYASTGSMNRPGSKGAIGLEIDKLSRKAVDIHWEALLDKVIADAEGKPNFTTILIDSYEVGMQNWTEGFANEFQKRRGYDLIPYLLCATGRLMENTETTERVLWDFRTTVAELMHENYFGYFAEKCHALGLKLAIEPYGSGTFDAPATALIADIPMSEFWDKPVRNLWQWTSQIVPSGAHLSGCSVVGAEAFTSMTGNFKDAPYSLKGFGDRAFARGVNRYYFHTFVHQPWNDAVKPGMTFGRFGGNYHRNNTWFMKSRAWMEYIARCQFIFQKGTYQADILALYGDERGFNSFLSAKEPIDVDFIDGINIDLGGISSLDNLSVDSDGEIRVTYEGKLLDTRYKIMLLKRADLMLAENVAKLGKLADNGAVIFAPKPLRSPILNNAEEDDKTIQTFIEKYWDSGLIRNPKEFEGEVEKMAPDCEVPSTILFNRTRIAEDDYYFLSNQKKINQEITARFRVSGKQPEIWDPISGEITEASNWKMLDNGTTEVQLSMTPFGSAFVVFRTATLSKGLSKPKPVLKQLVHLNGKWNVTFDPNWGPKQTVVFDELSPWNENSDDAIKYFSGSAIYHINFFLSKSQMANVDKSIYLNLGQVENFAAVKLNGVEMTTLWKPPYRLEISEAIKHGVNILEVEVTNLWVNRLIGDERFPAFNKNNIEWLHAGEALPGNAPRKTFVLNRQWKKGDELLPSGLIGPVLIEVETEK